jgi:hypothetical protein
MTVSTTASSITIEGNGTQTIFNYNFEIPYQADGVTPAVAVSTLISGTTTVLSSSQYAITGIGVSSGGTVTYPESGSNLPAGGYITIQRAKSLTQDYAFPNASLLPETIEQALDTLTLEMQQIQNSVQALANALGITLIDPNGS